MVPARGVLPQPPSRFWRGGQWKVWTKPLLGSPNTGPTLPACLSPVPQTVCLELSFGSAIPQLTCPDPVFQALPSRHGHTSPPGRGSNVPRE